jgi:Fatty acid desaturase
MMFMELPATLNGAPKLNQIKNKVNDKKWGDYRSSLKPRYKKVWFDIGFAYFMLASAVTICASIESRLQPGYLFIPILPLGSLWTGFWLHYLLCFFHEATHYNIFSNRKYNDWAANLLIGSLIGLGIKSYRKTHWLHHANLGTTGDTETSYFEPLKIKRLALDLAGRYQFNILLRYFKKAAEEHFAPSNSRLALAISSLVHLGIFLGLLISGYPLTGLMWLAGFSSFYPMFNRIRQTIEHRSYHASEKIDYRFVDHGAENRIFGNDLFSRNLGAAGFNRHLLHHWDPALSYTQFDAMEKFMMQTQYRAMISARRTTYWKALRDFLK